MPCTEEIRIAMAGWPSTKVLDLLALTLGGAASLALLVGTTFSGFTWLIVPLVALTALLADRFRRLAAAWPRALLAYVAVVGSIAVVSILTGLLNGLSDEPYSTPAYASLGLSMYTHPVSFDYVQYGVTYHEFSYDVYLPLLTFVQVPFLDYRWVALAAWAGTVYLLRRDAFAAGGLATPWIAVLAANGQNDFVPLLALTGAIALGRYRGRWFVELVALGLKQFANVLVFLYHLARREYRAAALSLVATLAILAPFLWVDPGAVYCHVVVGDPTSACAGHSWSFFVFKRNYWLYPTWALLVFHPTVARWVRTLPRRLRRGPTAST